MPTVASTGWSTSEPDPLYRGTVYDIFDQYRRQLQQWGSNVSWNLPQVNPNDLIYTAGQTATRGSDVVNEAWNTAGNYYNAAGQQFLNLSQHEAPTVGVSFRMSDALEGRFGDIFKKYDLLTPEQAFQILGKPDTSKIESYMNQILSGAIGAPAQAASAVGFTATAVDPRREVIRDVTTQRSIDQLQEYLEKLDPAAFNQLTQVAQNELERQRQIQLQQVASQAAAQEAFGGARHGVVEAETNRAALDAQAKLSADMAMRKLEFANAILQSDLGRQLTADQINQAADMAVELERARLGTQANIESARNQTQASIATAANMTNANIAAANARMSALASMVNALADLEGRGYASRANLLGQMEAIKPNMITAQTGALSDLYKTDLQTELLVSQANANLGMDWLNFQRGLGQDLMNLGNLINASGALTGTTLGNLANTQLGIGTTLTNYDLINQWNNWYSQYMANMWPVMLTEAELGAAMGLPYGTSSQSGSTVRQPVSPYDWAQLGLGLIGAIAASDPELKTNVKPAKGSLERIKKLEPKEYSFKVDPNKTKLVGLLADEVGPDYRAKVAAYNAVNLEPIVADIVGAVRELAKKVERRK
jgi:hypothetical protein